MALHAEIVEDHFMTGGTRVDLMRGGLSDGSEVWSVSVDEAITFQCPTYASALALFNAMRPCVEIENWTD